MMVFVLVSSILSIASVFFFFGNAVSITTSYSNPSLPSIFDTMFGYTVTAGSTNVSVRYPAMTWLFCCEILIIAAAIFTLISYFKARDYGKEKPLVVSAILLARLNFMAFVTSCCTPDILGVNPKNDVKLGWGLILYGIFQLISFVGTVPYLASYFKYVSRKISKILKTSNDCKNDKANAMTKSEKIDLLMKYKSLLDSGVITDEEFENKKAELLK